VLGERVRGRVAFPDNGAVTAAPLRAKVLERIDIAFGATHVSLTAPS